MSSEREAWFLFGGAVFFLMGLTLALDAEGRAESLRHWMKASGQAHLQGEAAGALTAQYRLMGLFLLAVGAGILAAEMMAPERLAAWFKPKQPTGPARIAGGVFFALSGFALAALKAVDLWSPPSLRGLERELGLAPEKLPLRRRAAAASGWLLVFVLLAFSLQLLRRPG